MITFKQFLLDDIQKNIWTHLTSSERDEYSSDLLDIVKNAYKHTSLGSFVRNIHDVRNSEWLVLDHDDTEDIDVAIFYRLPRNTESWVGKKIQGIGHDGTSESKTKLMQKLSSLLDQDGWWIEASGLLSLSLRNRGCRIERDQEKLKSIFPGIISFNADGSYLRNVDGLKKTEIVFGNVK